MDAATDAEMVSWLVCRVGSRLCALPLSTVVETMRPLPVEHLAGAPQFVIGLSIVRGAPVAVVDANSLLGEAEGDAQRFVTIKSGGGFIALAVDGVIGIRSLAASASTNLPPLLREANGEVVAAIGTLDAEFLLFLQTARLVPREFVENLAREEAVP